MEKVSIELFGLVLMEPTTFLTDLFLTLFSLGLYFSLRRAFANNRYRELYARFFLFMAICTFIGGTAHLFGHYINHYYFHALSWSFSALGIYYMQRGSAYDYKNSVRSILDKLFLIQLVISIACYFGYQLFGNVEVAHGGEVGTPGFTAVVISSTIGFAGFILPLHLIKFIKENDNGSAITLMAFVLSVLALIIQAKKWGIGLYFNHNDVAHVVLAGCYYVYYLGMRLKIQHYEMSAQVDQ